jgi:predicted DNA-binding antitoxin AbrB/MazE fold protein
VVRARYEKGVPKPLERLELRGGEEVEITLTEDIVEFARRVRALVHAREETSEVLSRERGRLAPIQRE